MNFYLLSPELAMVGLALVIIVIDLITTRKEILPWVVLVGLAVPAALVFSLSGRRESSFSNALVIDEYAVFFKLLLIFAAALVTLASVDYVKARVRWQGEYYAILLFATLGMMLLSSAGDLITIYIALELSSLSLCTLVCFLPRDTRSNEAAIKFLLLASFSSAVLLYGMALLYGLTGTTNLVGIGREIEGLLGQPVMFLTLALLLAGFGFKIAAFPFQMWAPDVYQGAPTPITAFLSVASKAAGFAVVMRFFTTALGPIESDWRIMVAVLAALTMTVGNLMAFPQTDIKRLLAYSSIAHVGYVMVGLAAAATIGTSGVIYYLLAYAVTNMAAFFAVIAFSNQTGSDLIEDYSGLSARAPLLSLGLTLSFLSLMGMPITAGFVGKVYIFYGAYQQGLFWLVIVGVLNSFISMYYYVRVIRQMYLGQAKDERPIRVTPSLFAAITVAVVGILVVAVLASPFIGVTTVAARSVIP